MELVVVDVVGAEPYQAGLEPQSDLDRVAAVFAVGEADCVAPFVAMCTSERRAPRYSSDMPWP